jgi:hypothetical protein
MGKRVLDALGCRKVNGIFAPPLLISIKVLPNGEKRKLNGSFKCGMRNAECGMNVEFLILDFAAQNNFFSAFRIPHSAFRIPHSAFRIPHSAFRI